MKKYLLEINHPGQVYLFKNIYKKLCANGNQVTVTTKENPSIEYLLNFFNIPYIIIGKKKNSIIGKGFNQLIHDLNALKLYRHYKFDIGFGTSVTNDHTAALSKMKSIHFSDDDMDLLSFVKRYSYPFSDTIISPSSLSYSKFKNKVVTYQGTHELAYLHPNYFKPDPGVLKHVGLKVGDPYFVLRFVALKAYHDAGHKGISRDQKKTLINYLEQKGRVFITSEKKIEKEFEKYHLPVPPENIHSLLYFASMFLGDSQTMTSEAAILGTPALKCNTFAGLLSVPNELEYEYDLCYAYHPDNFREFFNHIQGLLERKELKAEWKSKQKRFLAEKIDVTAFMVWFLEKYPKSKYILQQDPEFQNRFK